MVPASRGWTPARILMRVDLPAPFSPSSATISPAPTSIPASASACVPPKCFDTPRMERRETSTGDPWTSFYMGLCVELVAEAARLEALAELGGANHRGITLREFLRRRDKAVHPSMELPPARGRRHGALDGLPVRVLEPPDRKVRHMGDPGGDSP